MQALMKALMTCRQVWSVEFPECWLPVEGYTSTVGVKGSITSELPCGVTAGMRGDGQGGGGLNRFRTFYYCQFLVLMIVKEEGEKKSKKKSRYLFLRIQNPHESSQSQKF